MLRAHIPPLYIPSNNNLDFVQVKLLNLVFLEIIDKTCHRDPDQDRDPDPDQDPDPDLDLDQDPDLDPDPDPDQDQDLDPDLDQDLSKTFFIACG